MATAVSRLNKPIGGVKTKWWLVGGAAAAGVAYWEYTRSSAAAASATTTPTTAPATDPNIDPATGVPYADEGLGDSYGTSGFGNPYGYGPTQLNPNDEALLQRIESDLGNNGAGSDGGGHGHGGSGGHANNQHWQEHAVDDLVKQGYSRIAAEAAIAAYLTGAPLTPKQLGMVESAIGSHGLPPNPPRGGVNVVHHHGGKRHGAGHDGGKGKGGNKQGGNKGQHKHRRWGIPTPKGSNN